MPIIVMVTGFLLIVAAAIVVTIFTHTKAVLRICVTCLLLGFTSFFGGYSALYADRPSAAPIGPASIGVGESAD